MLTINTNLSSLIAQSSMKSSTNKLNQAIERMTTGFKINHAKDNAANYAIATDMTTKLNSLQVAEENTAMGLDLVNTASEVLDILNDRVERLRALQEQANNGTYGEDSLNAINKECNALVDEIVRIYGNAEYNGITLFMAPTTLADGSVVIAQESDAQLTTTFEELQIASKHFEIYDANDSLVQAYDIEESDTIADFFSVLQGHGFTTKLLNGEIMISSAAGSYIIGDLATELGIDTEEQTYVVSTNQSYSANIENVTEHESIVSSTTVHSVSTGVEKSSTVTVYYTENIYVDESTQLGELINFDTYDKTVRISNSSGSVIADGTFSSTDTVGTFLNFFRNRGLYAAITDGVITIDSRYLSDQSSNGILEQMGMHSAYTCKPTGKDIVSTTVEINSTSLSTLGVSTEQYITVSKNGSESIITVKPSDTFSNVVAPLMNLGISVHVGATSIIVSGTNSSYIVGMTPELAAAWGFEGQSTYNTALVSITATQSDSLILESIQHSLTEDTTFGDLGVTYYSLVGYNSSGGSFAIGETACAAQTVGEFITELAGVGINASIVDGKFKIEASESAWINAMGDSLKQALKLDGDFSTVLSVTTTISTTTTTYLTSTTVSATGSTKFEDLGVNSSFKVTVVSNGTNSTFMIGKDTTFNEFYAELQARGITVSESGGQVVLTGAGDTYLKSEKLMNLLGMSSLSKTEGVKKINTKSDYQFYNEILEDVYAPGTVNLLVGTGADEASSINVDISFKLEDLTKFRKIGLDGVDYLDNLDNLLEKISAKQVQFGAVINRLESVIDEIGIKYDNLVSSRSTIRDADIAEVSSTYIQQQILQQASATLLATANQSPAIALQLI